MTTPDYSSQSLKILLVDDEQCIRHVLGELLRTDGHFVGLAVNGAEALEKFNAGTWDVVLTDRAMPVMDGEQLATEIKKVAPQTPVIMITGFAVASCNLAVVDAVLPKPFSRAKLADTITACIATHGVHSQQHDEPLTRAA